MLEDYGRLFTKRAEEYRLPCNRAFGSDCQACGGGHSGDDIGLGRANGARLMIWLLQTLPFSYELAYFSSGTAHNAIPTQAQAVIPMDPIDETVLRGTTAAFLRDALEIYGRADPELALTVEPVEQPQTVLPTEDRDDSAGVGRLDSMWILGTASALSGLCGIVRQPGTGGCRRNKAGDLFFPALGVMTMPYYKSGGHNMPWLRKDWGFLCGSRDMVRGLGWPRTR